MTKKINSANKSSQQSIQALIEAHKAYEQRTLSLLASASYSPNSIRKFSASSLTNITTEGFEGARYHPGSSLADELELLAIDQAKEAFSCAYANVQPHSASSANASILLGFLNKNDTIMGMDLSSGGHLTHGASASFSGKFFRSQPYRLTNGLIDFEAIRTMALRFKPAAMICGASSYPRSICFKTFRSIADEVGAILIADISHISGLVIAGFHESPMEYAHFVTTSTYKQLLGPRGGLIMSQLKQDYAAHYKISKSAINKSVFPLTQGTPNLACIASKAAALSNARTKRFHRLMGNIVSLADHLARSLRDRGFTVVTGGTDTHMILLNLQPLKLTGLQAEQTLESIGILANRNLIPDDPLNPKVTSGLRIGTNMLAQRDFDFEGVRTLANILANVLVNDAERNTTAATDSVKALCEKFPINKKYSGS